MVEGGMREASCGHADMRMRDGDQAIVACCVAAGKSGSGVWAKLHVKVRSPAAKESTNG